MPLRVIIASVVTLVLAVGGCALGDPIVPKNVYTMVNNQGRERTYDLAWQDIRRFEGALTRGELLDYSSRAVVILSRMNRLAQGKAGAVRDRSSHDTLDRSTREAMGNNTNDNLAVLAATATELREAFDAGNFTLAQQHAVECLGYARAVGDPLP